jgi:acyl transferase domain-containing protein
MPQEMQEDSRQSLSESMLWTPGSSKAMYSNRISFLFDFRGPSLTVDTACSSSMVALDVAVTDLRLGIINLN